MADSALFKVYKIARWVVLAVMIVVVLIMLRKPAPPAPPMTPAQVKEKAQAFEAKLADIEKTAQAGGTPEPEALTFTSEEVNAFVQDATARAAQQVGDTQNEVKNTQLAFTGDEVIAQSVTQRYGQDIYVTVRGRLDASDGYLHFYPSGFKVGDLNVPVSMVDSALQKKLNEPDTREKLRLPEFIRDLKIENGNLKIVPR